MNVLDFQKMKDEGRKISMVTCYDYSSARAVAKSSVGCVLVGDSRPCTDTPPQCRAVDTRWWRSLPHRSDAAATGAANQQEFAK